MKPGWRVALFAVGAALFVLTLTKSGPGTVIHGVKAVGSGIVIIFALSFLRLLLQTHSWRIALRKDGIRATTTELAFLRLASQAIGYLTVLGPAASEPLKINFLQRRHGSAIRATLVDSGVYWLSIGLVMIIGCFSATLLVGHNRNVFLAIGVFGTLVATAGCFAARSKSLVIPAVFQTNGHVLRWARKAAQIGSELKRFAQENPNTIRQMFLLDVSCQVLLLGEVAVAFWSLHLPLRPGTILTIEAAGRVVRMAGGWMPARLGADESGAAATFALLGLSTASGLAFALVRRTRDMLNSLAGLAWLAWQSRTRKDFPAERIKTAIANRELECKL